MRLKKKTQVGLLTNMYPGMFDATKRKHILPSIEWDVIVDSSLELLQKPNRKLFELAEKKTSVPHDEILSVDNGREHVQEAQAFGRQTFLYDSSNHHAAAQELDKFLRKQEFRSLAPVISRT